MDKNAKISLPAKVARILNTLGEHGYEAYAVGGCVRDSLLGRTPQDWDITTSARPEQVKALFRHTIDTGIQHGTVTVMLEHEGFEVTTYRIDGEYEDARHPKEVAFTANLLEDLKRRDFTINAMAYNEVTGLVDAFDGIGDLERGVIRCVGNAMERFSEDALRMLRAVRFAAQLGFSIEQETQEAIAGLAGNIKKVSAERIQVELVKLLTSPNPGELKVAYRMGLTAVFLPEFDVMMETPQNNPHHCCSVGEHTLKAIEAVPADKVLRLTMLLHDIAKPACRTTDKKGVDHFYGHPVRGSEMAAWNSAPAEVRQRYHRTGCAGWCTGTMIIRSFPGRRSAGRCTGSAWNSIRHCLRSSARIFWRRAGTGARKSWRMWTHMNSCIGSAWRKKSVLRSGNWRFPVRI